MPDTILSGGALLQKPEELRVVPPVIQHLPGLGRLPLQGYIQGVNPVQGLIRVERGAARRRHQQPDPVLTDGIGQ